MCSITGGGERLHNVLRQIGSKLWCPWQQILFVLAGNEGFLYWQVMRTCIKSQTRSNFGQIGPLTTELAALGHLKHFSYRLVMGKCCLHASSFILDQIIFEVSGNQDRHKSSVELDFGLNQTAQFGVHSFELEYL